VPFIADQPFWGARIHALGVCPAPIPVRQLTSERLSPAIREFLGNTGMRDRAAQLRQQMIDEDGVHNAVQVIQVTLGGAQNG